MYLHAILYISWKEIDTCEAVIDRAGLRGVGGFLKRCKRSVCLLSLGGEGAQRD